MKPIVRKSLTRYAMVTFLVFSLVGCVSLHQKTDLPLVNNEVIMIYELIAAKKNAVETQNPEIFLSQIDPGNKTYYIEQKRWFEYFQNADTSGFDLKILDITKRDNDTYVARITQTYAFGSQNSKREISFNEKFVRTNSGWKDSDLEFQSIETDHFIIKGVTSINRKQLNKIAKEAEVAYDKVVSAYGSGTGDKTVIKLYDSQKLLKDLTKAGMERSNIGGWFESKESIKIFVDRTKARNSAPLIAHELVHKITLVKSNNLCAWFAEGLATYFGEFNVWGKTYIRKGWLSKQDHIRSLKWMESQNFETLKGWKNVGRCYGVAGMIVKHIEETYGQGKSIAILEALTQYPQRGDEGFEFKKHNTQYVEYLNKAIKNVLKIDLGSFDKNWQVWMKSYKET